MVEVISKRLVVGGAIKVGPGDWGGRLVVVEWQVRTVGQRNARRSGSNLLLGHGLVDRFHPTTRKLQARSFCSFSVTLRGPPDLQERKKCPSNSEILV